MVLHLRLGKLLHLALHFITFTVGITFSVLICVTFTVGITFRVIITFSGEQLHMLHKYMLSTETEISNCNRAAKKGTCVGFKTRKIY